MTGESKTYKYISPTAPSEKINYSYSTYEGEHFLNLWKENRKATLDKCLDFLAIELVNSDSKTEQLFNEWIRNDDFNNILKAAIAHRNIPKMAVRIWPEDTSLRSGPGP